MAIHRVYALPRGGEKAKAKCGYATRNLAVLAVGDTAPEGACLKCWPGEPHDRAVPRTIALLSGSVELDPETIEAILEDRSRPTNHNRSPKAA